MPNFNCVCDVDRPGNRTLAEMRTDLLRRLGYSAQAANPPPGMAELLDSFLHGAHRMVHRTYPDLRLQRIFSWTMLPGERYYGIGDNREQGEYDGACPFPLDPHRVSWVSVEDLNGTWYPPLVHGIPPEFYTSENLPGWPQYYEIRSCIEVFPAPTEAYTLRIKGFSDYFEMGENDPPDVDSEPVFLLALANAKAHYGKPDASRYEQQAFTYISKLVAGSHQTARYIPGAARLPPEAPPVFLPLLEE